MIAPLWLVTVLLTKAGYCFYVIINFNVNKITSLPGLDGLCLAGVKSATITNCG